MTPGNYVKSWQQVFDVPGNSFLDVGCWEGQQCAAAKRLGASRVLGVDLCACPRLRDNVAKHGFQFLQMDITSERWLALPRFDNIICYGVLYHVLDPFGLLVRLRMLAEKSDSTVIVGTEISMAKGKSMEWAPGFANNPSNWWKPTEECLISMMGHAGFTFVNVIARHPGGTRIAVSGRAGGIMAYGELMTRKEQLMELADNEGERFPRAKRKGGPDPYDR